MHESSAEETRKGRTAMAAFPDQVGGLAEKENYSGAYGQGGEEGAHRLPG